jgi:hypothetical protein
MNKYYILGGIFIFLIIVYLIILSIIDSATDKKIMNKIMKNKTKYKINFTPEKKFNKNLLQTYKSIDLVPEHIIKDVKNKSKDWEYYFYDDKEIIEFLQENYGQEVVDKFNSFKSGAHKADLFRICWLYIHGGVYLDIDARLLEDLNNIVIEEPKTCIMPKTKYHIFERPFNAFIITPSGDEKLKECIERYMMVEPKELRKDYFLLINILGEILPKGYNQGYVEKIKFPYSSNSIHIYKNNKKIIMSKNSEYYGKDKNFK